MVRKQQWECKVVRSCLRRNEEPGQVGRWKMCRLWLSPLVMWEAFGDDTQGSDVI